MGNSTMSYRFQAGRVIAARELKSLFLGIGVYITATVALLGSAAIVSGLLGTISDAGLVVHPEPLMMPFLFGIVVCTFYLGILATIAVSRERDRGTLEVLFYGPVDAVSYVLARFAEHLIVFCVVVVFSLGVFALISGISGLLFTAGLFRAAVLSLFFASTAIAFGLFLSSATSRMRNSIIVYILVMAGFALFSVLQGYVSTLQGEVPAIVDHARAVVALVSRGIDWVSPVAYLSRGIVAARIGNARMLAVSILGPVVYTVVLLLLSVLAFERKGVRAR